MLDDKRDAVVQHTQGIGRQSVGAAETEGDTALDTEDKAAALGKEVGAELWKLLRSGTEDGGVGYGAETVADHGARAEVVALLLRLLEYGKNAREHSGFREVKHVGGVGADLVETARIRKDCAPKTGTVLRRGVVQNEGAVSLTRGHGELLLLEDVAGGGQQIDVKHAARGAAVSRALHDVGLEPYSLACIVRRVVKLEIDLLLREGMAELVDVAGIAHQGPDGGRQRRRKAVGNRHAADTDTRGAKGRSAGQHKERNCGKVHSESVWQHLILF
ncbi:MAG: hypothetical protein J5732_09475 [Bacteroidaceae bacterium]|nr:hypothetical protein [Bacteroidaceae bacterium]